MGRLFIKNGERCIVLFGVWVLFGMFGYANSKIIGMFDKLFSLGGMIILTIVLFSVIMKSLKCQKCNVRGSIKLKDMIHLGKQFRTNYKDKYRYYYECKKCGHKRSLIYER